MSAVGGKGRFAVCFWVSAKIPLQQTKPDDAPNSVALDFFQRFVVKLAVQHIVPLL
jgi:hypothetical protein